MCVGRWLTYASVGPGGPTYLHASPCARYTRCCMAELLLSASWLLDHLSDPNLRLVDTRFLLGQPDAGREAFDAGHIPGAVFADLEGDLSAPVRADRVGGRHPLPDVPTMESAFSRLGISAEHHHVVAYDDGATAFYAPHLWWMLKYLGHDAVSVLEGGLPAWVKAGGALSTGAAVVAPAAFQARLRQEMIVDAAYVGARSAETVLIDARAPERYRGDVEPLDWKAGHIPGAVNKNWAEGMQEGRWKNQEAQRARFPEAASAPEVVVYCGSGVSAAGNLFALEIAGIQGAKLYAGSWSDWISDPARPIATGESA